MMILTMKNDAVLLRLPAWNPDSVFPVGSSCLREEVETALKQVWTQSAKSAKSGGLTWLGGAAWHPSHRPKSAKSAKWLWALTAATSIVC
ncbi:hypothetical protein NQZ68_034737 [Dissostichus eleginoides]|nr:hypothetical protein NQZ68_034737 [Dissostichus eleginoides]